MEASLPASTAFNPATIRSAAPQAAATTAPSVTLPLRFMLTGVIALLVGAAWLVAQPVMLATYHYNQNVIAVTHLFLLGWICSVVMGAMYQLVPVALETRLHRNGWRNGSSCFTSSASWAWSGCSMSGT
jgi:hypothetical protein